MAYTLTGRKSGTVRFVPDNGTISDEKHSMSSKVTAYPIEDGSDINDHVVKNQQQFSVTGIIVGGLAQKAALTAMREQRDIITYSGRFRMQNLVITNLTFGANSKNADGCSFTASFEQVQITSAEYVEMGEAPLMSQQDSGKSSGSQTKSTSKDGRKTTSTEMISNNAYVQDYTNNFSKPTPSSGPSERATPSYNGIQGGA